MASKLKHKKRSKYSSHDYKPFQYFINKAQEKAIMKMLKGGNK